MADHLVNDTCYTALLGVADVYLRSDPPRIRECIHCLEATFCYKLPPHSEAHVRVQLGSIYLKYTENIDLARSHFERSVSLLESLGPGSEELLCQAVTQLKELYKIQNEPQSSIPYLQLALKATQKLNCLHLYFETLFELAEIYASCNDVPEAIKHLTIGEQFSQQNGSEYMRCLFILSKVLYLLVAQDYNQATMMLGSFGTYLELWRGPHLLVEHVRIFYLSLRTWLGIASGQPKTTRADIKQLQHSIQVVTSLEPIDGAKIPEYERFQWLPVDHLCIIVYLLTVVHCMQTGHVGKSLKYSEKALEKISSLKEKQPTHLLSVFELLLLENVIVSHVIEGQSNHAIKQVANAFRACSPRLMNSHNSMLHTLLGLYSMSMNQMEFAEFQFRVALRACRNPEQYSLIALNLCVVYIRMGESRKAKLEELIQNFSNPKRASLRSSIMMASYHYIMGLKSFFEAKYQDARRYLRETLKISNPEESHRLTACALILLGHTFLKNGNIKEALEMVRPGMQMAEKMPDAYIQLWGASLLRDLYRHVGDHTNESGAFQIHSGYTKKLLSSHGEAIQSKEHKLIEWHKGLPNVPPQEGTSKATSEHQPMQVPSTSMLQQT
ncbi:MAU2 chromatid cohesion factor homolog [Dendronephthya gigantea]|uniref:MAU2 chromatid cohesion factor homolog n=1 Tax=Dendronephthya gigantea TaxID=151771 RepID=UPI00106AA771|nr:MAU2 chromatid cohesion factor homolog [Dendronephthya gigantea]